MIKLFTKLIHKLETEAIPFLNYIILFFAAIALRNYLETFSQRQNHLQLSSSLLRVELIHYSLSYIAVALAIMLIYKLVTQIKLQKIARVVLPGFLLLIITPVLDFLVTQGHGINILYLQTMDRVDLLQSYLTYVGGFSGITLGMKCEVLIVLIASYFYCRIKNANVIKSLFAAWLIYTVLFLFACLPIVIRAMLEAAGYIYIFSNELMIHSYLVINFVLVMLLARYFKKNFSTGRLVFFTVLFFICIIVGTLTKLSNLPDYFFVQLHSYDATLINLFLAAVVIFFATLFLITHDSVQQNILLLITMFYAAMINTQAFLCASALAACFYFYKAPPCHFKQSKILSILLFLTSLSACVTLGYYLVA